MALPNFPICYRLASPSDRLPRSTEAELRDAFPEATQIKFLGAGAFGDTWRVDDDALKIIVSDAGELRKEREIAASARLNRHVATARAERTIFAAGADRSALFFDYIDGSDLATWVTRRGPLAREESRGLAIGLLTGIGSIHESEAIHRDIKPENVQLRDNDPSDPVILDFGLAYVADLTPLTDYPAALGTRAYMPPEVLRGDHALRSSDIYAIGITLAIAATGRHPFLDEGDVVTRDELDDRIRSGVAPDADDALARVIAQMLNPSAWARPKHDAALTAIQRGVE